MSKNPHSDAREMMLFCAKHGITVNKEPIWRAFKHHEALAAAVKSRLQKPLTESESSKQLSLNLGPRSTWKVI